MKGSLHLATVTGIPVKIHWTFGLLLLWVVYVTTGEGGANQPMLYVYALILVLSVFFCVILHEFGHALAARRFGVRTFDIIMTPIGGIARLERMPEGRGQEFWVALAGPMVNFLIVGLIWLGFFVFRGDTIPLFSPDFWNFGGETNSYFKILLLANGYLGTFNLLPAFPMDGGRMLRSLLSLQLTREGATRIASYTGQVIALGMFAYGLINTQPTLTLIGVFIFFSARSEYQSLARQVRMSQTHARDLMSPLEHLLFSRMLMSDAREAAKEKSSLSHIVWSRPGIPAGYITRDSLMHMTPPPLADSLIDAWVIPAPVAVSPDLTAAQVFKLMQEHRLPLVLVFDQMNYLGVIHWEKLKSMVQ